MTTRLNTIQVFARMITDQGLDHELRNLETARNAFIDTISCILAGSRQDVTQNTLQAVSNWGQGNCVVAGHDVELAAPFAAMVNAASGHALDFDDYDLPANAHPSVVIFPALMAMVQDESISPGIVTGKQFIDAYIVGLEVMQRLGECMNMTHYRKGWLTTLTLGSIGAAAACARLTRIDKDKCEAAISLACTMASGLTNQGGFTAKQLNPGLAAKNGVMAEALARSGVTANSAVIDGPISIARSMGSYEPDKFEKALSKVASPWSIKEFGLYTKPYPSCGYTSRVVDAAVALHKQTTIDQINRIVAIEIAIPDYYLDLLVYPLPENSSQAMFSAEYAVAYALIHGEFDFNALKAEAIDSQRIRDLCKLSKVVAKTPIDSDRIYDPNDPDIVTLHLNDGKKIDMKIGEALGSPVNPLSSGEIQSKFDRCLDFAELGHLKSPIWEPLSKTESCRDIGQLLNLLKTI